MHTIKVNGDYPIVHRKNSFLKKTEHLACFFLCGYLQNIESFPRKAHRTEVTLNVKFNEEQECCILSQVHLYQTELSQKSCSIL